MVEEAGVARLAAAVLTLADRLGSGSPDADGLPAAYRVLGARLAAARGALVPDALQPLPVSGLPASPEELPAALARLHERVLALRGGRKSSGSYFTPRSLVGHLLDVSLERTLEEGADPRAVTLLDPACGTGVFLVEAVRRLARRGVPLPDAVLQVHGVDTDPAAVELARASLVLELVRPECPPPSPRLHLRVADALAGWEPERTGGYDVVAGNPPFLTPLQKETARRADHAADRSVVRPYTDLSAVFLHRATAWVRDGGRVVLVQPQSLLAARDAAGVRREAAATCALEHLWASDTGMFDAGVLTCAPVLRRGVAQGPVRRTHGPRFRRLPDAAAPDLDGEWSPLLAAGLGIPEVLLPPARETLGSVASCTADFRDQYYGLAGAVHEAAACPDGIPLVTSGLVEPARCAWGERPARFLKRRWEAPVVDVGSLDDRLAAWARSRAVPKVLVRTQSPVVEAVADEAGAWLPSVPTITVAAEPDRLWHVLAVLLAPPVAAYAAARYAGTGLTMRAVKLSARQVAGLPLPADAGAWDEAAALVRCAQRQPATRRVRLVEAGRAMCAAYRTGEEPLTWWQDRLRA